MRSVQPFWPDVKWEPLKEFAVTDSALSADPEKKSLLSAASTVTHITPVIGTELLGIDLRQLSKTQKDELCVPPLLCDGSAELTHVGCMVFRALLVAERGVVCKSSVISRFGAAEN